MASIKKTEVRRRVKDPETGELRTGKGSTEGTGEFVWKARYRSPDGKQHVKTFPRRVDAQNWLDAETAKLVTGTWVAPKTAKITFRQWSEQWLDGYATRSAGTVRTARWHVRVLVDHFGDTPLFAIKPSDVKVFSAKLGETYNDRTRYAIYRRLGQVLADAVHDGVLPKSPVSRRTTPGPARQREFFPTVEQVKTMLDAMPEHLQPAVLLGAYAGMRVAEVAALRISDVDFMRGVITPAIQHPARPLKTDWSTTPIPIPDELALALGWSARTFEDPSTIVTDEFGQPTTPWAIEQAWRDARAATEMPAEFRFHDLRHFYASALIDAGLSVMAVKTRMRHANATTTMRVYAHLFRDEDESSRAAVSATMSTVARAVRVRGASSLVRAT